MNHDDKPMWDDPAESSRLRQLLRAGRDASSDYNVERGVVRHLANLRAGAPLPGWASSLPSVKTAATPVLAWLAVPLLAATALVGVWVAQHAPDAARPLVTGQPIVSGQPAAEAAASNTLAMPVEASTETRPEQQPTAAVPAAARVRSKRFERSEARVARSTASRQTPSEADRSATQATQAPIIETGSPTPATGSESFAANAEAAVPIALPAGSEIVARASAATASVAAREPAAELAAVEPEATAPNAAQPQRTAATRPAPVSDDSRLEREMQMLAVAQRVLADDPSRALHLARQGEREFSGSMFSAERKQVALLALVRLGELDEARRLGRPFLVAYPNAPWSERLRRALASGRLPAP